jgi:hypothetical protein
MLRSTGLIRHPLLLLRFPMAVPSEAPQEQRMAGWTGLEPAAFCVTGRRSNQLSYHPEIGKRRAKLEPENR